MAANFDKELAEEFSNHVTSAKMVEVAEKFMELSKAPSHELPDEDNDALKDIHDKLRADFVATDEFGNRKMADPKFAADWRKRVAESNYQG